MDFDLVRTVLTILVMIIQCVVTIIGGNVAIAIAGGSADIAIILLYRNEVIEIYNKIVGLIRQEG